MGIFKICVIILLLIYTIYTIDAFFIWWHNEPETEKENNSLYKKENNSLYKYVLQEQKFCKNGEIIINSNNIQCVQKFMIFKFSCNDTECKTENIRK